MIRFNSLSSRRNSAHAGASSTRSPSNSDQSFDSRRWEPRSRAAVSGESDAIAIDLASPSTPHGVATDPPGRCGVYEGPQTSRSS